MRKPFLGTDSQTIRAVRNAIHILPEPPAVKKQISTVLANQVQLGGVPQPKIVSSPLSQGPPGRPNDGDIWIATGVDGAGAIWQFRYNAESGSPYRWEFMGGTPLRAFNYQTLSSQGNSAWSVPTGGAPSLTIPRDGDWLGIVQASWVSVGSGGVHYVSLGAPNVPWQLSGQVQPTSNDLLPLHIRGYNTGVTTGTVIYPLSFSSRSDAQLVEAYIEAVPIRIS